MPSGILFGLGAAVTWGLGDFFGGIGSRRIAPFVMTFAADVVGLILLLVVALALRPPAPELETIGLAVVAGLAGGLGLAFLYQAFSLGSMGLVSALAGGGAALIPLVVAFVVGVGLQPLQVAGVLCVLVAAVMATDSQILALSTMFTEDVFAHYEGQARFGEAAQVHTGRAFVIGLTVVAYAIALRLPESIFAVAVQYAFTGFAALAPLLVAALFWRGSTKWGALASTLWVAAAVIGIAAVNAAVPAPPPGQATPVWTLAGYEVVARTAGGPSILGLLPVVPVVLISALLMLVVSALTPKPGAGTIARYFPDSVPG